MDKKNMLAVFLALLLGALGIIYVSGVITTFVTIPSDGETASANLSVSVTSVHWGVVNSNSENHQSAQVQNTGNVPLTLSLSTTQLPTWLQLSWNYTDHVLQPSETIGVDLLLSVGATEPNIPFNFDITVTGVQA